MGQASANLATSSSSSSSSSSTHQRQHQQQSQAQTQTQAQTQAQAQAQLLIEATLQHEAIVNGAMDYQAAMRAVYLMANISSGANPQCVRLALQRQTQTQTLTQTQGLGQGQGKGQGKGKGQRGDSTDCIFPQHLAPTIRTPLFAKQPKYDQWQIWHVVGKPSNSTLINEFGSSLLSQLRTHLLANPRHAAFVDSCTHHCTSCSSPGEDSWNGESIRSTSPGVRSSANGMTASDLFQKWLARERRLQSLGLGLGLGVGLGAGAGAGAGVGPGESSSGLARQSKGAAAEAEGGVFAMQDRPYPCSACCLCHA